jgi:tetraacyldisaccharide 4'-kinase
MPGSTASSSIRAALERALTRRWQRRGVWSLLLAPLAALYCAAAGLRRLAYRRGWAPVERVGVPVIVIGNLTVGGTGKTPLVLWLARFLRAHGYRPGLVARGYGGRATGPLAVTADSDPGEAGDEAVLLARRSDCPVVVGRDRAAAARRLLAVSSSDVIVSDDGLQHYRLGRDIEIAVLDGRRRLGNGLCLPAGPLREPPGRLRTVDLVVANGEARAGELGMELAVTALRNLQEPRRTAAARDFAGTPLHAVAGIGHPARFFDQLRALGLTVIEHPFPDHHRYRPADLEFGDAAPVIMTEKDAVKCRRFAQPRHWVLEVEARPDPRLGERILQLLKEVPRGG